MSEGILAQKKCEKTKERYANAISVSCWLHFIFQCDCGNYHIYQFEGISPFMPDYQYGQVNF